MFRRTLSLLFAMIVSQLFSASTCLAVEPPILRLEADVPTQIIWSLAFSPDGSTLYSVGSDKLVHAWTIQNGHFTRDPDKTLRVPLGAGQSGVLNSLAVSNDGKWLAVGGIGWSPEFLGGGFVRPIEALSEDVRRDLYALRIFNLKTGEQIVLRGHSGPPRAIMFIDGKSGGAPELFSVADHPDSDEQQEVRHWSIQQKQMVGPPLFLAKSIRPPILRAWRDRSGNPHAVIVITEALDPGLITKTHLWHPAESNRSEIAKLPSLLALDLVPSRTGSPQMVVGANGGIALVATDARGRMGAPIPAQGYQGNAWQGWGLPLVAASFRDRSGINQVAVLTASRPAAEIDLGLVLYNTSKKSFGQRSKMWVSPELRPPHIAIAPNGRYAALAGMPNNGIRILDGKNVAAGKFPIQQTIQSERLHPKSATFVTNGSSTGIAIGTQAPVESEIKTGASLPKTSFILNLDVGRIAASPPGWKISVADSGGWKSTFAGGEVTVTPAGKRPHTIGLPQMLDDPARRISAALVVPPDTDASGNDRPALLFAASNLYRNAEIGIYNANDGTLLQLMSNHLGKVTHLSLDKKRQVLLSTAEDGSVSGWWIGDLSHKTIGNVGTIGGLIVEDRGPRVTISKIDAKTDAAVAGLQVEDVIEGVVYNKKLVPLQNANDLYVRIARRRPGSKLVLRVAKATGTQSIEVPIRQGADEKLPLFTVTLDGQRNRLKWTAWTPAGYYDGNSDPASRLGWHTNTGIDREPVTYVSASQFNPDAHQVGLLQTLISDGPLPAVDVSKLNLKSVVLFDAKDESVIPSAGDVVRMKTGPTSVQLKLPADENQRVRFVELLQIGSKPDSSTQPDAIRLHETATGVWVADLDAPMASVLDPSLQPKIQIAVRTTDTPEQRFVRDIAILPFARPPQIVLANRAFQTDEPFRTQATSVPIHAEITSEQELETIEFFVDSELRPVRFQPGKRFQLQRLVELSPGRHTFKIQARSGGKVTTVSWAVVCEPPPFALTLKSISSGTAAVDSTVDGDRIFFAKPVSEPVATIQGRLTWQDGQKVPATTRLQLWHGGFMNSIEVDLSSSTNSVEFQFPVVLANRKNVFRIAAPQLPLTPAQVNALSKLQVDCEQPLLKRPVYAVVVGAQMKVGKNISKTDELQAAAVRAIAAADSSIQASDVQVLGPLVGEQATGRRMGFMIRTMVQSLVDQTGGIAVVYFAGKLHSTDDDRLLFADSENYLNPEAYGSSFSMARLRGLLLSVRGSHAVFLDTQNGQAFRDGQLPPADRQFENISVFQINSSLPAGR